MPTVRAIAVTALTLLAVGLVMPASAQAAAKPRVFKNCTEMHKVYKGGVARSGARDVRRSGGHAKYKPVVNTALYNANKKSDADHDGIACEQ
ncbi:MAG: excalibur calcium-binding domain-containing protein [Actinomycetota bacterium]|nr:excalibur calcium-binding domain-containing protein [Actinomycetota bacterium]MDQ2957203.1 excalibur calcium-binding domain-containing protein [Actinomycetota bacterium]